MLSKLLAVQIAFRGYKTLFVDSAEHRGLSVFSPRVDRGGGKREEVLRPGGAEPCFVFMQLGWRDKKFSFLQVKLEESLGLLGDPTSPS